MEPVIFKTIKGRKIVPNADLACVDFRYEDLTYANLSGSSLIFANLSNSDLRFSDLSYTDLAWASFDDVDLCHTNLQHCKINPYTRFFRTKITESQLIVLTLCGWQLTPKQVLELEIIKD